MGPPAGLLAFLSLIVTAWTLVHVTVLTMSLKVQLRDRSLTGVIGVTLLC